MKRSITAVGLLALGLLLAACSSGGSATPAASIPADAIQISANNLQFSTDTLTAPAGEAFQIAFDNQESAPHNVAIYRDAGAAEDIFVPEPFSGPAAVTYDVPALAAGTYFFRCDVHPDMAGELSVG